MKGTYLCHKNTFLDFSHLIQWLDFQEYQALFPGDVELGC